MRTDKAAALKLRSEGMSYGLIHERLGVPKSTLSNWLRDVPYSPNREVLKRIETGQGAYGLRRREQRLRETEQLHRRGLLDVGNLSRRDLMMLGLGLWIGEGSKTLEQIRFANSDPQVVKVFLRWLREVCKLQNDNITVAMHLYPTSDQEECQLYWSKVTDLPRSQFRKTQIDRRLTKNLEKAGKTPYGTLHVAVVSNGDPEKGVKLYRRMMGWVHAVSK